MSREIDKEPNTKKKYLLFLRRESKCRSIDKVYYSKPDSKLQSKLLIRLFGLEEKEIRKIRPSFFVELPASLLIKKRCLISIDKAKKFYLVSASSEKKYKGLKTTLHCSYLCRG